jgi:dTMP kinase
MALFITFEGGEGCGKSTQIAALAARLTDRGIPVLATREPGGCAIADAIRRILLDPANAALVPRAELLLYAAARAQHVDEIIQPALSQGTWVLCDRFTDATVAYQGGGRQLPPTTIETLNRIATDGLQPDLTLLLDLPVEEGLRRAIGRNDQDGTAHEGRFEAETLAFHQRVRVVYRQLAEIHERFRVVDAFGTVAAVAGRIDRVLDEFLAERGIQL